MDEAAESKEKPRGRNAQSAERRRQFVLDYLSEHPYIMNADVCTGLGVASATANRLLVALCHDGTLERIRRGKYWAYRLR